MRAIGACLALLVCASSPAGAQADTRVGVVVSLRVNVAPDQATALAGKLGDLVATQLALDVVAGADVDRLLPESVPESCVAEPECIRDVAQRLEADELLFLAMVNVSDKIQIDTTWVEAATGESAPRPMLEIDPQDPDASLADAPRKLLPDAKVRATEPEPAPGVTPPPIVPERTDHSRGERTDEGRGKRIAGLATGVSGVAVVVTGALFLARASGQISDLEDDFANGGQWTEDAIDRENAYKRNRRLGAAFTITGAAALATGSTLYILGHRERSPGQVAVSPTTRGGVLVWSGAF